MKKLILGIIIICSAIGVWFAITEIYTAEAQKVDLVKFEVKDGESAYSLAERLAGEQVVRNAWLFKKYLIWKGIDKKINVGEFEVGKPITLARVASALSQPGLSERTITIIPGWDLRDLAKYWEKEGLGSAEEFYKIAGEPAEKKSGAKNIDAVSDLEVLKDKPGGFSYEGYLAPDTYRIYKHATTEEVIVKLIKERDSQFTPEMYQAIEDADRTLHEILTMASILEKEVKNTEDRAKVADIFWRRYDMNWALQADSTVHYAVGKEGEIFTTQEDRDSLSPWNTYRYPGMPPGPICNPSLDAIKAAIYPEENNYWYFLTDKEGAVRYAKDLEEHNENKKYL
jgi:UPF0755 protein